MLITDILSRRIYTILNTGIKQLDNYTYILGTAKMGIVPVRKVT
jgi:hypothetical protein